MLGLNDKAFIKKFKSLEDEGFNDVPFDTGQRKSVENFRRIMMATKPEDIFDITTDEIIECFSIAGEFINSIGGYMMFDEGNLKKKVVEFKNTKSIKKRRVL